MQIEEAMAAIIDNERMNGRSEEDIPNSPLLQRLAEAQRAVNPDVFAAGSTAGASGSVAGGAAADLRRDRRMAWSSLSRAARSGQPGGAGSEGFHGGELEGRPRQAEGTARRSGRGHGVRGGFADR